MVLKVQLWTKRFFFYRGIKIHIKVAKCVPLIESLCQQGDVQSDTIISESAKDQRWNLEGKK